MTKLGILIVGVLAFAGCKKKDAAGGKDDSDCARAIFHSMELSKAAMAKQGNDTPMLQKITDLGIKHCKEDQWPPEAIKCMVDAPTMQAAQGCYGKLTQQQQDSMNKAALELMQSQKAGGSAAAAAPTGGEPASPPAGDGSGSAAATGSGSAAPAGSGS